MSYNPVANPATVVILRKARFTFLTDQFIRMEWAEDGRFEDRPSLAVVNRRLPVPRFRKSVRNGVLTVATDVLTLTYREDGKPFSAANLSCRFNAEGIRGTWRFGQKDRFNLGGTFRTLDGYNGDCKEEWKQDKKGKWYGTGKWKPVPLPPGLVSRSGWSVFDDTNRTVLDPTAGKGTPWVTPRPAGKRQDFYFMAYGHDFRRWVRDAAQVFGRQPLPPRFALGYWYSRYWAYTDREIESLVGEFNQMGVPLDVVVIDMDWHKPGWTGYSWDRGYFPDPDEHLRWLKKQGLQITLNLHPAKGVGDHEDQFEAVFEELKRDRRRLATEPIVVNSVRICGKQVAMDMTDPDYVRAYFKHLHHPMERKGVDFWWMDWQQGTETKVPGLDPLPWINHLHWTDMATNPERKGKRPICFSRYGGVGAGRYPVGFSGDTYSTWDSLAFQPRFTATAANVLYGYWSHDIGGHMRGNLTPELHARWVQFGAFSPVLRSHSTKSIEHDRRFWNFPEPYRSVMVETVRRRYAMIPYIYTENRRCFDTGLSLCRPLYYHHPDEAEAYRHPNQYYFGEAMMVAPVVEPADEKSDLATVNIWLPKGRWFDVATGEMLTGGQTHRRSCTVHEVPQFVRPGTIIPGQIPMNRTRPGSYPRLTVTCYPGGDGAYDLYEDDGVSCDYLRSKHVTLPFEQRVDGRRRTVVVRPARGSFRGFLARRTVEIRLPGSVPPVSVKADGRAIRWRHRPDGAGWAYDGDTATTIIRIAAVDLRRMTVIEVVEDARVSARQINGLSGRIRRLALASDLVKLVSPCWPYHAEERLIVRAAQTGNRISRNPATAARELAELRRSVARLPRVLREYEAIYRKRKQETHAGHLARARAILSVL